ncbi:MAG: hypothetical protein JXR80_07240 [Deltaproteobacteria bacterium]|nr:hypothetical protein [Deltaproteobacteria bacterium]
MKQTIRLLLQLFLTIALPGLAAGAAETTFSADLPALFTGQFNKKLEEAGLDYRGFVDLRGGRRLRQPLAEESTSMAESRLQLELNGDFAGLLGKIKGDLFADAVDDHSGAELREAFFLASPLEFADLKVGRQIMTWGTGDLLFINDLFPKDWKAFFIGRDDEYLKAPADAARLSLFFAQANLDFVYMPRFNPSSYIDGHRLSYWFPGTQTIVGRNHILRDDERSRWFDDDEIALRLYRNWGGTEVALYFYDGYWKTPEGMLEDGRVYYPGLQTFGASLRTSLEGGLAHLEVGHYDSKEDRHGDNPLVRNSEWRLLIGYEHEVAPDLTAGLQYYLEYMEDYDNYRHSLPPQTEKRDQYRHLLTLRLTQLLLSQNLKLSLFAYYSPSDQDAHLRPQISYKLTDNWLLVGGANLFSGESEATFFGQFEENSNAYAGLRYNF